MFPCPRCRTGLTRATYQHGAFWGCETCRGRVVALSVLRKAAPDALVTEIEVAARAGTPTRRRCPVCTQPMVEVLIPVGTRPLVLDVCRACQFTWFDPGEYEGVPPPRAETATEPAIPTNPRWALAIAQAELIAKRRPGWRLQGPEEDWKLVPGILGLPVEWEPEDRQRPPAVTWTLGALIAFISASAFVFDLRCNVERWGLLPAAQGRSGGLTLVTSFFLHGGILHLLGNLYFLLSFGDNVEDELGPWPYVGLIAGAALGGAFLHTMFDPRPDVPVIGASAGISGVIVFYALRFPRARLALLLRFFLFFHWLRFPAWVALIGWVVLQVVAAGRQVAGLGSLSALGHLGGAAVGFAVWLTLNTADRPQRARPPEHAASFDPLEWLPPEPQRRLALALIGVGVLAVALRARLGLGVGFSLLFLAAQLAYSSRFGIVADWLWAFIAGLVTFWFFFTRGAPWDAALVIASAISGVFVAYRVLRDWGRPLLED